MELPAEIQHTGMTPEQIENALYGHTYHTPYGDVSIDIKISPTVGKFVDPDTINDLRAAADSVLDATMINIVKVDPERRDTRERMTQQLLSLFPEYTGWEPITNKYCSNWCCWERPWLRVSLPKNIGEIEIGFRKRVISLDWTGTTIWQRAEELFPAENVTKEGRLIHAWSLDDARKYIVTLYERAGLPAKGN